MNNLEKIKSGRGNNKQYGFTVPDNYFEELPLKIQERISGKEKGIFSHVFVHKLNPRIAYVFSFIILIIFIIGVYFVIHQTTQNQLTSEDLIEYAVYSGDDFDDLSLMDEINTDENTDLNDTSDYIIEYLLSDNIDYLTILENY